MKPHQGIIAASLAFYFLDSGFAGYGRSSERKRVHG